MTENIVAFAAATVEAQNLRIDKTTKRGLKSQCKIGELHSLPSTIAENVATRCSDVKPKVSLFVPEIVPKARGTSQHNLKRKNSIQTRV